MWRIIVWALSFGVAGASLADTDPAPRRVLTIDEQPRWGGVGRLNHSAGGFCSGALIAPDTVLTAAHCVIDERTNRAVPPLDRTRYASSGAMPWEEGSFASIRIHGDMLIFAHFRFD